VEVTPVPNPTGDTTPDYTFSSTEAGTITYGGDCSSSTTNAVSGNNTITFNALAEGTHSNCTITVTDAAGNTSDTLNVSSFTIDTPPVRSNGQPTGNLSLGTTTTTISLDTNENATCRYSTTPGIAYSAMTNTFATTGGTHHTQTVSGLSDGNTYHYYVRCSDSGSNANVDDFEITFNVASTCTSFTYSDWGACQPDGKQTRTVISSSPSGCMGGSPVLEQSCTYTDRDVNDFTPKVSIKGQKKKYKLKKNKKLYLRKKKLRFKGKTEELAGGRVELLVDGKVKDEGIIGSDGKWRLSKKIKKTGNHKLKFRYFDATGNLIGESSSYRIKIDTRKPKFLHLPSFLTKRIGDRVHFEATDRKSSKLNSKKTSRIKYYKYYFDGKKHKTKNPQFIIPAGTSKGLHTLKIKAYDKAGNKVKKTVIIRVR
jgi:hypothetical protein